MLSRLLMAVLVVVLLAAPGWAQKEQVTLENEGRAPAMSFLGGTGVFLTPTADVIGASRWAIGYHHLNRNVSWEHPEGHWRAGEADWDIPKVNFGIGDAVEVGVGFVMFDAPWGDKDEAVVHAKWRFLNDRDNQLRMAVGIWDIFDQIETRWYVAATKGFGGPRTVVDLTAGYIFGDEDPEGYRQIVGNSFFASVNWHALRTLDVLGEVTKDDFNYGVRWWPWERINVDAAIMDGGGWGVGLAYTGNF